MRKAGERVVGRCEGMDRAELEGDGEGARGLCSIEKTSQYCCPKTA